MKSKLIALLVAAFALATVPSCVLVAGGKKCGSQCQSDGKCGKCKKGGGKCEKCSKKASKCEGCKDGKKCEKCTKKAAAK